MFSHACVGEQYFHSIYVYKIVCTRQRTFIFKYCDIEGNTNKEKPIMHNRKNISLSHKHLTKQIQVFISQFSLYSMYLPCQTV